MVRTLVFLLASLSLTSAQAATPPSQDEGYYKISGYTIEKIADEKPTMKTMAFLFADDECNSSANTSPVLPNEPDKPATEENQIWFPEENGSGIVGGIGKILGEGSDWSLDVILNLASKAWTFIQANKPVVNLKTATANALPRGAKCWDQLSGWQMPRSEIYAIKYKNMYNSDVVRLEFRLVYSHGGNVKGVGRYLTHSTIQFKNVRVLWGWKLDADVQVPLVMNVGTTEAPVAGMQLDINWKVRSTLVQEQSTASFFISGDGRPTTMLR